MIHSFVVVTPVDDVVMQYPLSCDDPRGKSCMILLMICCCSLQRYRGSGCIRAWQSLLSVHFDVVIVMLFDIYRGNHLSCDVLTRRGTDLIVVPSLLLCICCGYLAVPTVACRRPTLILLPDDASIASVPSPLRWYISFVHWWRVPLRTLYIAIIVVPLSSALIWNLVVDLLICCWYDDDDAVWCLFAMRSVFDTISLTDDDTALSLLTVVCHCYDGKSMMLSTFVLFGIVLLMPRWRICWYRVTFIATLLLMTQTTIVMHSVAAVLVIHWLFTLMTRRAMVTLLPLFHCDTFIVTIWSVCCCRVLWWSAFRGDLSLLFTTALRSVQPYHERREQKKWWRMKNEICCSCGVMTHSFVIVSVRSAIIVISVIVVKRGIRLHDIVVVIQYQYIISEVRYVPFIVN